MLDPAPPPTLVALAPRVDMAAPPPTPTRPPPGTTYVVQPGDQLRLIAARYGVSLASILAVNAIPDPDLLAVGKELVVPTESSAAVATWPPAGSRTISAVVTGYANGSDGGSVGSTTASGSRTHWGTVAADPRRYPFGTKLVIEGFPGVVFVVEDTGSGVQGDLFDVWFPDAPAAVRFGAQRRQVAVLPPRD